MKFSSSLPFILSTALLGCSASAFAWSLETSIVETFPWAKDIPGIDSPGVINGMVPEGEVTASYSSAIISASVDSRALGVENSTLVFRDVRKPGTRSPIHIHKYSGTTCVEAGRLQLLVEGSNDVVIAEPGDCYTMPALTKLSAFNLGPGYAIVNDIFRIPCGEFVVHYIEPGFTANVTGNVLYDGSPDYFSSCAEQLIFEPQNDDLEQLMALTSISLSSSAESDTKTRPGVRGAVGARSRDNS